MGAGSANRALAVLLASIAAGVLSTLVQMLWWWIAGENVVGLLLRDARLTAALVLGPAVVPPATGGEAGILLLAGAIHAGLSLFYAVLLLPLRRSRRLPALLIGTGFGLLLYLVNLYGLTVVFPWFEAARSGAALAAHIAFGVVAMLAYSAFFNAGRSRPAAH